MKRKYIIEIICTLLILLFVYTATSKLMAVQQTYHEMNKQPFPDWMTPYLTWGVSLAELIVSGMLLFDRTKRVGLWASLILMTLFSAYIGAVLLNFFEQHPCSCGGVIKQLGWTNHLYFNLFFVAISITGILLMRKTKNTYNPTQDVVFT